jgi:hypothetical protein
MERDRARERCARAGDRPPRFVAAAFLDRPFLDAFLAAPPAATNWHFLPPQVAHLQQACRRPFCVVRNLTSLLPVNPLHFMQ